LPYNSTLLYANFVHHDSAVSIKKLDAVSINLSESRNVVMASDTVKALMLNMPTCSPTLHPRFTHGPPSCWSTHVRSLDSSSEERLSKQFLMVELSIIHRNYKLMYGRADSMPIVLQSVVVCRGALQPGSRRLVQWLCSFTLYNSAFTAILCSSLGRHV